MNRIRCFPAQELKNPSLEILSSNLSCHLYDLRLKVKASARYSIKNTLDS